LFFDTYSPQWRNSSGEVQYFLAKALRHCVDFIGLKHHKFPVPPLLPESAKQQPWYIERKAAFERLREECGGFEDSEFPAGLADELRNAAVASGYPGAVAQELAGIHKAGRATEARAKAEALVTGPIDPEVANGLVNYLGSQMADVRVGSPPFQPRPEAYVDAWRWVMCDVGMDCGPDSRALRMICLYRGVCGAASYPDYLRSQQHSPASFDELSRIRLQLLEGIRQGDLTLLGLPRK
jgi:hypothetical protein